MDEFDKYSQVYSQKFDIQHPKSINSILAEYFLAYELIANTVGSSKSAKQKDFRSTFSEIDDVFKKTTPKIENRFTKEIDTMAGLGNSGVVIPILRNQNLPKSQVKILQTNTIDASVKYQLQWSSGVGKIPISDRIWKNSDKERIFTTINNGFRTGKSSFEIAKEIEDLSQSGNGFFNAQRLAFTETSRAYHQTRANTIEVWNNSPYAEFELGVYQFVSNTHRIYDICDELAGYYRIENAPALPRHGVCGCHEKSVKITSENQHLFGIVRPATLEKYKNVTFYKQEKPLRKDIVESQKVGRPTQNILDVEKNVGNYNLKIDNWDNKFIGKRNIAIEYAPVEEIKTIKGGWIKTADKNVSAVFDANTNKITINSAFKFKDNEDYVNRAVIHEIGHGVDFSKGFSKSEKFAGLLLDGDQYTNETFQVISKRLAEAEGVMGGDGSIYTPRNTIELFKGKTIDDGEYEIAIDGKSRRYYTDPEEMFAESYKQYRLNSDFGDYAPRMKNYFDNLTTNYDNLEPTT